MADFLEALMLLCFGLSWPVSLIKNIRSGTAKGMSLCSPSSHHRYIAGISAKIYTGNINYVLLVYIWNIVSSSATSSSTSSTGTRTDTTTQFPQSTSSG